jgi:hypothetical protein
MTNKGKLLPFVIAAGISTMICPSLAPAAVIYSNGFENGGAPPALCSQGGTGTNPLLSHTGCLSVVPTSSINAGTGSFVAFADPNQTSNGTPVRGSTFGSFAPLVDGYHGRYELSFTGSEVRQLVFVDAVWDPFFFPENPESPFGGEVPQSYESGEFAGSSVSIENNRYLVTFDLDERTRFANESGPPGAPPGTNIDPALPSICGPGGDQTNCILSWTFAIDNGGWLDDIELNYLGAGEDGIPVPEPGTLYLILTGLIAAGTIKLRKADILIFCDNEHASAFHRL